MLNLALAAAILLAQTAAPQIVRAADGTLAQGYEERRACAGEDRCGPIVVELETGRIIMFDGEWATGFEETGHGQEVRKRPPPPSDGGD